MSNQNNENKTFDPTLCKDELSDAGEIKQTKTFLNNKKRCTEKVMKKTLKDYAEERENCQDGNEYCSGGCASKFD